MKINKLKRHNGWLLLIIMAVVSISLLGCTPSESKEVVEKRAERLEELLEAKYNVDFEILHGRYNGTNTTNTFGIRSDKYPYYSTASLYNEGLESERLVESYGAQVFSTQSDRYIMDHLHGWFNEQTFFLGGEVLKNDQSLYRKETYDLDYYDFENIHKNHKELLGYGGIALFYILDENEEIEEGLFEGYKNFVLWMQEWGAEEASISFYVYDHSAINSEHYKKYINQEDNEDPYEAWEMREDLAADGYFKWGSSGGQRLNIDQVLNMTVEEFHNEVIKVMNIHGEVKRVNLKDE